MGFILQLIVLQPEGVYKQSLKTEIFKRYIFVDTDICIDLSDLILYSHKDLQL